MSDQALTGHGYESWVENPLPITPELLGFIGVHPLKNKILGFDLVPNAVKNSVKRELKVKQEHVFLSFWKEPAMFGQVVVTYIRWMKPASAVFKTLSPSIAFHDLPLYWLNNKRFQWTMTQYDTVIYSPMDWIAELHFMIIITISQHMHSITHSNSQESSGNWVGPSSRILVILGKGFVLWKRPKIEMSRPLKW